MRTKNVRSTPPWPLLQFLPPGSCVGLLPWVPSVMEYDRRSKSWDEPFPPWPAFSHGVSSQLRHYLISSHCRVPESARLSTSLRLCTQKVPSYMCRKLTIDTVRKRPGDRERGAQISPHHLTGSKPFKFLFLNYLAMTSIVAICRPPLDF